MCLFWLHSRPGPGSLLFLVSLSCVFFSFFFFSLPYVSLSFPLCLSFFSLLPVPIHSSGKLIFIYSPSYSFFAVCLPFSIFHTPPFITPCLFPPFYYHSMAHASPSSVSHLFLSLSSTSPSLLPHSLTLGFMSPRPAPIPLCHSSFTYILRLLCFCFCLHLVPTEFIVSIVF